MRLQFDFHGIPRSGKLRTDINKLSNLGRILINYSLGRSVNNSLQMPVIYE